MKDKNYEKNQNTILESNKNGKKKNISLINTTNFDTKSKFSFRKPTKLNLLETPTHKHDFTDLKLPKLKLKSLSSDLKRQDDFGKNKVGIILRNNIQLFTKSFINNENISEANKNGVEMHKSFSNFPMTALQINPTNLLNKSICRICLDNDTNENEDNKLISPCLCQGSIKYVHETCLKSWINQNFDITKDNAKCEICKHKYFIKQKIDKKFLEKKWLINFVKAILSIIIFFIVLGLIGFLLYIIFKALKISDRTIIIVFILIIIFEGFIFILFIITTIRKYRKVCYEETIIFWTVANYVGKRRK